MRIGLVGAGPWALHTHAPALAAHPGVTFTGLWARRPEAAADTGIPVYESYPALVENNDAVAFAVPPSIQAALAPSAAERGRHLILEKPLANTLSAANDIANAARENGARTVMFLTRRYAPETREFLESAKRGDWAAGDAMWLSGALLGGPFAGSQWRREGGALRDIGPHVVDVIDAALGPVEGVVSAHHERRTDTWMVTLRHRPSEGEAQDAHAYPVRMSSLSLSMRTPVQPSRLRVSVYGESGIAELGSRDTSPLECYATMLDEFLESCALGQEHACNARRGVHLQWVIEAIERVAHEAKY
ncbi:Gfo/Idh/MocA family oxidoreductase [Hoyosella sp. YIM 151337]|uniref:Gfo/Idh/MocA family protein n=1 Tax=Hoyosella sp. YIM 151337 TaxID=2992742 RepID=UPI002235463B|nr:Gfo/Idh/MocA family oxidoreductase [Hoyosella sp. YIM 151337]MCW4352706.1 Gfo/Idh/MocA family oxidoreductase [Hoyosella sp. YIM 151337]